MANGGAFVPGQPSPPPSEPKPTPKAAVALVHAGPTSPTSDQLRAQYQGRGGLNDKTLILDGFAPKHDGVGDGNNSEAGTMVPRVNVPSASEEALEVPATQVVPDTQVAPPSQVNQPRSLPSNASPVPTSTPSEAPAASTPQPTPALEPKKPAAAVYESGMYWRILGQHIVDQFHLYMYH